MTTANYLSTLLVEQIREAHKYLEGTMSDVTEEQAHWLPQGKANPIGASYVHLLFSEDYIINAMLRKQKPLYATSWADKAGVSVAMPRMDIDWEKYGEWTRIVKVRLPQLREYAKAVYKVTEEYLESVTEKDLKAKIDLGKAGKFTASHIISRWVIGHTDNITGEISCLKGFQGLKGYPE